MIEIVSNVHTSWQYSWTPVKYSLRSYNEYKNEHRQTPLDESNHAEVQIG